jgi:hypothetical protein
MKFFMKAVHLFFLALGLLLTSFGVHARAAEFLSEIKISNSETVSLPPGSWAIQWKNDFNFCGPNSSANCRQTDGRVLILTNQAPESSPFEAIIIRHTNRNVKNWDNTRCYSRTGNVFFDSHGTWENHLLNKCSFGNSMGMGVFFSPNWWWSSIRKGTEKIPSSGNNTHLEVLLQSSGKRRYQLDIFMKNEDGGTSISVEQVNAWKRRYVDALSASLFDGKPAAQMASLQLLDTPAPPVEPTLVELDLPPFFSTSTWTSPIDVGGQLVMTPIKELSSDDTVFILDSTAVVSSPADGRVVYRGEIQDEEAGFVIDHGQGIFSIIASEMRWNVHFGPVLGESLTQDQFLFSTEFNAEGGISPVRWSLVYLDPQKTQTSDFDAQWLANLKAAPKLNTRLIANIGSTVVRLAAKTNEDNAQLALNDTPLPLKLLSESAILTPMGFQSLKLTTGKLFKKSIFSALPLMPARTLEKTVFKSDGQWVIEESEFLANDLTSTKGVFSKLDQVQIPVALPEWLEPAPPVSVSVAATPTNVTPAKSPAASKNVLPIKAPKAAPETNKLTVKPTPPAAKDTTLIDSDPILTQLQNEILQRERELAALAERQAEEKRLRDRLAELNRLTQAEFKDDLPVLLGKIPTAKPNPRIHVLAIGINDYADVPDVPFADRSAEQFAKIVEKLLGVQKQNTIVLTNADATSGRLRGRLRTLLNRLGPQDRLLLFYAGHGVPGKDGKSAYLLAQDGGPGSYEEPALRLDQLYADIAKSRVGMAKLFIDACFSGRSGKDSIVFEGIAPILVTPKQSFPDSLRLAVMTAGRGDQFSNQNKDSGHRLFSYHLMRAMLETSPSLEIGSLHNRLRQRVLDDSRRIGPEFEQEPELQGNSKLPLLN